MNTPRGGLKPPKAMLWQGKGPLAESPLTAPDHLSMTEWPDAFDGNPVHLHQPASRVPAQENPTTITPASSADFQSSIPLSPQVEHVPQTPPSTLNPQTTHVDSGITVPVVPLRTTYLNQDELTAQSSAPLVPPSSPSVTNLTTEGSVNKPPMKQPLKPMIREVNASEGLMDWQPQHQGQVVRPVTLTPEAKPVAETSTTQRENQVIAPPKPEIVDRRVVEPVLMPPQREARILQPEKKPEALRPTAPPTPAVLPQVGKAQHQATQLVIGKITIEVMEAPKPSVTTQPLAAPAPVQYSQRKSPTRRDSILKYGLGQL